MNVVIVESPAKAKTINKYLGPGYTVLASYGHIRDLPAKDGSVRPEADFSMDWELDPKAKARIKDIADALRGAEHLYLATDPDREGEAISWHVREVLDGRKALKGIGVKRVVFNAITKTAIEDAFAHPRDLNRELVDAYLARRALDYLVGFTLSPVLWRKLPGSRSAGRVQSVALRLICDRENEIEDFRTQEYWSVKGVFRTRHGETVEAGLTHLDGRKLDKMAIATQERGGGRGPRGRGLRLCRRQGRAQADPPAPGAAVHHLDAAAGSLAQARDVGDADDAHGAAALRGHRHRRRDGRAHHLHADRRRADGGRGHRRLPRPDRRRLRREVPAGEAADLQDQGEERAGSPRGHPPDRCPPPAGSGGALSRQRPGAALRADLEADAGEPDGVGGPRPDRRRHRLSRPPGHAPRHRLGHRLRRLPQALPRGSRRRRPRRRGPGRRQGAPRPEGGRSAGAVEGAGRAALHPATAALHRSEPGKAAGGARHRPAVDLCQHYLGAAGPQVRAPGEQAVRARGPRPAGYGVPDQLLRALLRLRLHCRDGGEARRRLRRADRLAGGPQRLLA